MVTTGRLARTVSAVVIALAAAVHPALAHDDHAASAARDAMNRHWQERLAARAGAAVSVAADAGGRLWLARVDKGHVVVSRSGDGGKTFGGEVQVNAVAEAILADGQNRPQLLVAGDTIVVAWAQALPKLHSGHIRFARSVDGGRSFSPPVNVNDDGAEIGHSFPAMASDGKGGLAIAWLDARDKEAATAAGAKYAGSGVYFVTSADNGAQFSPNRRLAGHSCECCRIGLAYGRGGEAQALWRHVFGDNIRDFALARLAADAQIARASDDDWQIDACPHHGGALAIDGEGRRHLVWFTGSAKRPGIHYRYADGAQFSPPVALGDADAQPGHPVVFAAGSNVWLAWREFDGKQYRVKAQRSVDRGASWQAARSVAVAERTADLPIFVAGARSPLLAWYADGSVRIFDLRETR